MGEQLNKLVQPSQGETLLSGEKERAVDTRNSSDGSQGIHNEWEKEKARL